MVVPKARIPLPTAQKSDEDSDSEGHLRCRLPVVLARVELPGLHSLTRPCFVNNRELSYEWRK